MKAAVFDIETTGLDAVGSGILLCACVIPSGPGEELKTFRLDEYKYKPDKKYGLFERQEMSLLNDLVGELRKYDLLIGHNIERFDIKFLMTRAMRMGQAFGLHPFVYDTMKAFRRMGILTPQNGFGKPQAGLAAVADALGLSNEKTSVMAGAWWMSIWQKEELRQRAMDTIVNHCQGDVRMTRGVYQELLPQDLRATIRRLL